MARIPRQPFVVVAMLTLTATAFARGHVHRNLSPSLPIAAPYIVWAPSLPIRAGQLVEACPPLDAARQAVARAYAAPGSCPGGVAPFLKIVAAIAGDVVTVTPCAVLVNGRSLPNSAQVARDEKGREIVSRGFNTWRLTEGELWLYGTNPRSLDSRKFGPVPSSAGARARVGADHDDAASRSFATLTRDQQIESIIDELAEPIREAVAWNMPQDADLNDVIADVRANVFDYLKTRSTTVPLAQPKALPEETRYRIQHIGNYTQRAPEVMYDRNRQSVRVEAGTLSAHGFRRAGWKSHL